MKICTTFKFFGLDKSSSDVPYQRIHFYLCAANHFCPTREWWTTNRLHEEQWQVFPKLLVTIFPIKPPCEHHIRHAGSHWWWESLLMTLIVFAEKKNWAVATADTEWIHIQLSQLKTRSCSARAPNCKYRAMSWSGLSYSCILSTTASWITAC